MSSDESASGRSPDESTSGGPPDQEGQRSTGELDPSPPSDREGSRWGGYALAALLAVVFLVGLLRLVYPAMTGLLIGAILALFGVFIVFLAFRERSRES